MISLKNRAYVISDLHGNLSALHYLLQFWRPTDEQLIFVGDYMDRGKYSKQVLQTVKKLVFTQGAICLKGNHEVIFLEWLKKPEKLTDSFMAPHVGGLQTINSFLTLEDGTKKQCSSSQEIVAYINTTFHDEIEFIKHLPLYYEFGQYVIAHAGIDPLIDCLEDMDAKQFLWIRDEFYDYPHVLNKTVIFGHTPTRNMGEENGNVWISPCKRKIAIDGGGFLPNGAVNGIKINKDNDAFTVFQYHPNESEYHI